MPTYAYVCTACDQRFEIQQSFTDDAITACPQCQGRVRKLFNSVGIVFKGSGFYRTDSRSDTGSAAAKKEPAAVTSGNGSSDTTDSSGSATSESGSSSTTSQTGSGSDSGSATSSGSGSNGSGSSTSDGKKAATSAA